MSPKSPVPKHIAISSNGESAFNFLYAGDIQINVEGAFILDKDTKSQQTPPDTHDIVLPHHKTHVSHIAIDIGGSLVKIVYFSHNSSESQDSSGLHGGGRLNFRSFETSHFDDMIDFLKMLINRLTVNVNNHVNSNESSLPSTSIISDIKIMATGGGAYKFYDRLKYELNANISREDEMECLIVGLDFFITEIPQEVFCYSESNPMIFSEPRKPSIYPYLLVNIGSGVSLIKVIGPRQFKRIGGSSLGGGTLWGLLSLLTDANSYDEMLTKAAKGDNSNVDMLVGDIYGQDYTKIGLKASTIASSFGRVFRDILENPHTKCSKYNFFKSEDISRSLLYAISNNIGQIAYLHAQIHNLQHIYFGGSYIRGHLQTMHTLSYAINFWSQGTMQAYFLRHEGYLGAVGAFIKRQPAGWVRRISAGETDIPPFDSSCKAFSQKNT